TFAGNQVLISDSSDSLPFIGPLASSTVMTVRTDSATNSFTVPTMSTNTWYFLVVTRVGGTLHVYFNGKESTTGGIADSGGVQFDNIGGYPNNAMLGWPG